MRYHVPVLLNESIKGLSIKPNGTYLDLTFGGGGHSRSILKKLIKGSLISFDSDLDAININNISNSNIEVIHSNFKFFDLYIKDRGINSVDGIFADLGVSSYQIDSYNRGFTYKGKTELDMRMNKENDLCAKRVLNEYSLEQLDNILHQYGEISNSKKIAEKIINHRQKKLIKYNSDFVNLLNTIFQKKIGYKLLSKFFQAIRIEVNDELNTLKEMLIKTVDSLNKGGRLVIISYHSLEDRLVKNFINKSNFSSDFKKNLFGVKQQFFKKINKKPIIPQDDEIKNNPRSRSAKLRIGEKL
ncbi:MAG: 16S rRNA (cytosine(1402)-N(4))-methyltransferase [Cytophagia bacterium]|nr:16S rRNA (cytosine(1402)-N(4))-methyltransferase [Cytophagia bacterium]